MSSVHKFVTSVPLLMCSFIFADPGLFIPGGDILRGGELGTVDLIAGLKGSCGPPARVHNSIVFRNGVQVTEKERR